MSSSLPYLPGALALVVVLYMARRMRQAVGAAEQRSRVHAEKYAVFAETDIMRRQAEEAVLSAGLSVRIVEPDAIHRLRNAEAALSWDEGRLQVATKRRGNLETTTIDPARWRDEMSAFSSWIAKRSPRKERSHA